MGVDRRFLVPEVIQTSAMDCGPAALSCLLQGLRIGVSYARLREVCQTAVDGTSIDTLEEVANSLGARAEQTIIPVEHLTTDPELFPGITLVRMPTGILHFVVLWRTLRGRLQIMDPAVGRRWIQPRELIRKLHFHALRLTAEDWAEFARDSGFTGPLRRRLIALGASATQAHQFVTQATLDPSWRGIAALDAATRMVENFIRTGALKAGAFAVRVVADLAHRAFATANDPRPFVGPEFWTARPVANDPDTLIVRGIIVLQVTGVDRAAIESLTSDDPTASAEAAPLRQVVEKEPDRPLLHVLRSMRDDGLFTPALLGAAVCATALVLAVEALLLRGLMELSRNLNVGEQRFGAAAALFVFMLAVLAIEFPLSWGTARMGRRIEARLRVLLMHKIPRLDDEFFSSRLLSDMSGRCHMIQAVAAIPSLGAGLLRTGTSLLGTTIGIIWLAPGAWWLVPIATIVSVALPMLVLPISLERGMRVLTHSSALSKFYFDALQAVVPIRTHGAQRAVRREQEERLGAWAESALELQRISAVIDAILAGVGFLMVMTLIVAYVSLSDGLGTMMLMLYWTLSIPALGRAFATQLRAYPGIRNVLKRLNELLDAPERVGGAGESDAAARDAIQLGVGMNISIQGVTAVAGGHTVLDEMSADIQAGQHVAIVGGSGSGKSSLIALVLGWLTPQSGRVTINGVPLDKRTLPWLRARTAWVDPEVQIWNRSLLDNLRFGRAPHDPTSIGAMVHDADLQRVLERAPHGLQTLLGAGGCRMSGGEQQRVRFGRIVHREDVNLVLLDEAFRGLDRPARQTLMATARRVWKHATLLCVTHDLEFALNFDRVLVVSEGRIVEDGPPARLANDATSKFSELLRIERNTLRHFFSDPRWRRLWVEEGRVTEHNPKEGTRGVAS